MVQKYFNINFIIFNNFLKIKKHKQVIIFYYLVSDNKEYNTGVLKRSLDPEI